MQITSLKPPVATAPAYQTAPRTLTASVPGDTLSLGRTEAAPALMPKSFPSPVPSGVPNPTPPPFDPKVRQWKDDTIYFLLTDRFHDADPTNNEGVNKDDIHRWHGGDLQGVIDKLDYIRDTGSTAIWITPPMANQHSFVNSDGYHGYWPIDHYSTDKHVGTMEKFEEFVEKAHEKGLKVLLDIPLNHVAWEHPWRNDTAKHEWFHHNGDVVDWEDQFQAENHSIFGLPDLAQENPAVEKALMDVGKFWAGKGVDGFRLDAVKNVPRSFWDKFNKEMHAVAGKDFYLVGEYYHGDSSKFAQFQNGDMDGLVDYPLYYAIDNAFAKGGSMRDLANQVAKCEKDYPNPEMMSVFLDNHDTKRFMTKAGGDRDKLKMALTFQMTINRIPSVYYGTEVAMESDATGWSETSRRDMEWDKDPDMHSYFQKLTAIRNDSIAMRDGQILEMWQDDQVFAYSRLHEKEEAIVVLNNNSEMQTRNIPIRAESKIKDGTVLKELLTGQKVTVKDGKIESRLGGRSAGIYMPV